MLLVAQLVSGQGRISGHLTPLHCTRFLQGGGTELQCALCPQDTFFLLTDFLVLFKGKKKKKQIEKVRKCSLKLIKVSKENEKTSLRTLVWRK